MAAVDHVQHDVGPVELLQGALERSHQVVGELADKAYGIGKDHHFVAADGAPTKLRVEGGEQSVLHPGPRPGEFVEQGRLAGVGVAGQGYQAGFAASPSLHSAGALDLVQLPLEAFYPFAQHPPVGLELGLPLTTAYADATHLARQMRPAAGQAGQQVLELGQLDLGLRLAGPRPLEEDLQDQATPIHHRQLEDLLQVLYLAG